MREVPVPEHAEVEDRLARPSAPGRRSAVSHADGQHAEGDDERGVEPVLPSRRRSSTSWRQPKPSTISTRPRTSTRRGPALERRVEEERADHEEADHADRQVDVEDPPPRPVVGDPAADGRPQDRRQHDARSPTRPCAVPRCLEREDLPHDGLGHRDHRSAPSPWRMRIATRNSRFGAMPERNELVVKMHRADQEEAPAAEHRR